ncbi:MAG: ABC transporter permease subunit [Deltaproteobacteria bacterium]
MKQFYYKPAFPPKPAFTIGDGLILLGLAAILYGGIRLAFDAPSVVSGPEISLSPSALPWYALLSVGRMAIAYFLSLLFSLFYGYAAARNPAARKVLMPVLDVLQSVPILSFLPVVLLSLSAIFPEHIATEISAIVLIFTSQAWNITFSFYQSITTIPSELKEASAIFRFSSWLRFRALELPFAAIGLIWNSMMSWSGGWFFLMAAEIFHVGSHDFRLPGLGSYLKTAAAQGNLMAVLEGTGVLILVVVLLDQFIWRPLLAWADKFKIEMVEGDEEPSSWFLDILSRSWLMDFFQRRISPLNEWLDMSFQGKDATDIAPITSLDSKRPAWQIALAVTVLLAIIYGSFMAIALMTTLSLKDWIELGVGLLATLARVFSSLVIAMLWTIPVGVAIGTNRRLASLLQPLVQVVAAIPATALFPMLLLALLRVYGGLNIAAIALMLMGTQWYLLFNVIAGAAAIPQDLRFTTDLLGLSVLDRWRTLIIPGIFPYIITGSITASGGAWNASIVAEYVEFGGKTYATTGIGATIARATGTGNYALLLAGTLVLVISVILINRLFWQRLYRLAEERYRME